MCFGASGYGVVVRVRPGNGGGEVSAGLAEAVGRVLRPYPGKTTAEVHDYHDTLTGVLASSLAKRAPGYRGLGFPDPRRRS